MVQDYGTRATARVSTPHPPNPRPYNDYDGRWSAFFVRALSLDNPTDQEKLAQWMAQGKVLAVHSREAAVVSAI